MSKRSRSHVAAVPVNGEGAVLQPLHRKANGSSGIGSSGVGYSTLTVSKLRAELKRRGLSQHGRKAELVRHTYVSSFRLIFPHFLRYFPFHFATRKQARYTGVEATSAFYNTCFVCCYSYIIAHLSANGLGQVRLISD